MATKNKEQIVMDNMDNIKQWLSEGMTMESIAKALNMSKSTLYKYIQNDLNDIKSSRAIAIEKLENTMFTSAVGYERTVKKTAKIKRCTYENGKKAEEWEEMVEYDETIYIPPDTTAGIFLLKNWGGYMNEPRAMKIRQKELDLKEKQIDAQLW